TTKTTKNRVQLSPHADTGRLLKQWKKAYKQRLKVQTLEKFLRKVIGTGTAKCFLPVSLQALLNLLILQDIETVLFTFDTRCIFHPVQKRCVISCLHFATSSNRKKMQEYALYLDISSLYTFIPIWMGMAE